VKKEETETFKIEEDTPEKDWHAGNPLVTTIGVVLTLAHCCPLNIGLSDSDAK
jgi:hypothetical protein